MRANVPELLFASRNDFHEWLLGNAETSDGVWLIFGKNKAVITLSANDALEEALCFGWIDGQMRRIDETKYLKYFARRQAKSPWSEKNKKTVEILREKKMMTELGEKAVENAKRNGIWDIKATPIRPEQMETFAEKIKNISSPAYDNFIKMTPSSRQKYTRRHLSFKGEEARQRDLLKIIDELKNK